MSRVVLTQGDTHPSPELEWALSGVHTTYRGALSTFRTRRTLWRVGALAGTCEQVAGQLQAPATRACLVFTPPHTRVPFSRSPCMHLLKWGGGVGLGCS